MVKSQEILKGKGINESCYSILVNTIKTIPKDAELRIFKYSEIVSAYIFLRSKDKIN
ncbi:hypothetical protein HOH45_02110 [bacterium]|jgi:hypothetical protein|nr:hypothetical protein [bacterium]